MHDGSFKYENAALCGSWKDLFAILSSFMQKRVIRNVMQSALCIEHTFFHGALNLPACMFEPWGFQMFGKEAMKYVDYVECYPEGYRSGVQIAKECDAVNIQGFPTWIINGQV